MNSAHYELANSLLIDVEKGRRSELTAKINQLLKENAELGSLWGGVAKLAMTIGDDASAAKTALRYFNANKHKGESVLLQTLSVLGETGRLSIAKELTESISTQTNSAQLAHFCGVIASQLGEFKLAKQYFNRVLTLSAVSTPTMLSLMAIASPEEAKELLVKFQAMQQEVQEQSPIFQIQYFYALSKGYELINDEENAFEFAKKAAELGKEKIRNQSYEIGEEFQLTRLISEFFNEDFVAKYTVDIEDEDTEPNPIFILGLPRSGTTLLSQILTQSEKVIGGKEFNYCRRSLLPLSLKQIIHSVNDSKDPNVIKAIVQHFRSEYLYRLRSNQGEGEYFVDKSLDLTRYTGLLAAAFPKAKFIHISRTQRDVAWSCYKHFFNKGVPWSYDLAETKHFFDDFDMQIKHCQTILSNRLYDVQYELLVKEPIKVMSNLSRFIGTSFSDIESKLSSDENGFVPAPGASVATNSLFQVRQPLSSRFVGSSKPYERHFNLFSCE